MPDTPRKFGLDALLIEGTFLTSRLIPKISDAVVYNNFSSLDPNIIKYPVKWGLDAVLYIGLGTLFISLYNLIENSDL